MVEGYLWFDQAIRDHADEHGPSGGAWNISMILERLHRHHQKFLDQPDQQDQPNPQEDRGSESPLEDRVATLEKEMNDAMTDLDTLNGILQGIGNDGASLRDEFKNMEGELQAAQQAAAANQPVDLTNAILTARNAQAVLDGIVQAAATAAPAPQPTPTPTPTPAPSLTVSPTSLSGTVGQAITGSISVSGGTAPYSYSSSLADVSVDSSGNVTGTPATAETGEITVTDSSSPPLTATVPVTVS